MMVRKTKEEAGCTRQAILDAARQVFRQYGVARTTLENIAQAAGLTRGAVYWHFTSKAEVFLAMKDCTQASLYQTIAHLMDGEGGSDPLLSIERVLNAFFDLIEKNCRIRDVLEVVALRCEVNDAFPKSGLDHSAIASNFRNGLLEYYRQASEQGLLVPGCDPGMLAEDTVVFLGGLLFAFLSCRLPGDRLTTTKSMISAHLVLRRP